VEVQRLVGCGCERLCVYTITRSELYVFETGRSVQVGDVICRSEF